MLIEFTVGNYRSFKEPVTLSMVAANLKSKDPSLDDNNTFVLDDHLSLLTSAAIYGANASGKSNLIAALRLMRRLVIFSSKESQADDPIETDPFRLDAISESNPSYFEVVFRLQDITYRYGFEVTTEKVLTEWCFYSPKGKEAKLFTREDDIISLSRAFKGGATLKPLTRPNALFLSVASQFNQEVATKIRDWFGMLTVITGLNDLVYKRVSSKFFMKDQKNQESINALIRESDVGITRLIAEKVISQDTNQTFPSDMPQVVKDYFSERFKTDPEVVQVRTSHQKVRIDGEFEEILFDIEDESEGTQKLFHLSGPVIDSLHGPRVLVIDEIEARMHTLLTRKLINLFNSEETNPKHAQLVYATHDTNLLDKKFLRRDQIWFVEKDKEGASHLYSLAELKVRNDATFENDYLQGKYGGLPVLGDMRQLMTEFTEGDCADA